MASSINDIFLYPVKAFANQNDIKLVVPIKAVGVVGWPNTPRRRVPRKILERLLQMQKDKQFGRRWFEEFEAGQREFVAEAKAKTAVAIAAKEARETAELVYDRGREDEFREALRHTALVLEGLRQAKRTADAIATAEHAAEVARWVKDYIEREEDEEDSIMLLLH